jgi:hypothetical protein
MKVNTKSKSRSLGNILLQILAIGSNGRKAQIILPAMSTQVLECGGVVTCDPQTLWKSMVIVDDPWDFGLFLPLPRKDDYQREKKKTCLS